MGVQREEITITAQEGGFDDDDVLPVRIPPFLSLPPLPTSRRREYFSVVVLVVP